jgi:penicillin-binding protein 2
MGDRTISQGGAIGRKRKGDVVIGPTERFGRPYWVMIFFFCLFAIGIVRSAQLQLVSGFEYRKYADENRLFTRYLPAPRGIFHDRTGKSLVQNIALYKRATQDTAAQAYPSFEEISGEQALLYLSQNDRGVVIDQTRQYPLNAALALLLGYVGEVTKEELLSNTSYHLGETIGKTGLEKMYQEKLAGRVGRELYEMHASGRLVRTIAQEEPVSGVDFSLTIDASLSAIAFEALSGQPGAVVISHIDTGEILALVSSPSFDPNIREDIVKAATSEASPMLHRPIAGQYPPGSVFKMVTALAGLSTEVITPETIVVDEGEIEVGGARFGNWYFSQYGRTEGEVQLVKALQRSNDIYFYKVAEWVGPDRLANMAKKLRYGQKTGIALQGEQKGLIPDPEWKQKEIGESWYLGNTYHMGIGQGDVLVTPLQVNMVTSMIASNGRWCKPILFLGESHDCTPIYEKKEDVSFIKQGMEAVCSPGGTAFPFFDQKPVPVGCKTGTAEHGGQDEKERRRTHGWLTLYAPAHDPKIAMTVLVESTDEKPFQEGSADAGPIAKKLLNAVYELGYIQTQ